MQSSFQSGKERFQPLPPSSDSSEPLVQPSTLHAAKAIYQRYLSADKAQLPKPIGVAIDPVTHRGQLVFTDSPVLLPQECFIPIHLIHCDPRQSQR